MNPWVLKFNVQICDKRPQWMPCLLDFCALEFINIHNAMEMNVPLVVNEHKSSVGKLMVQML